MNALDQKEAKPDALQLGTEIVTVKMESDPQHFYASSVPIYQTATFRQVSATEMGPFDYSRSGNPTRSQLESHLAKIMRASFAFALNSGMSALDTICRLVNDGQEIVAGDDIYGGTNRLLAFIQQKSNTKVHHVDTTDVQSVLNVLTRETKLILLETPTNPLIKIADIRQIVERVHEFYHGLPERPWIVVDNTMMSPYLQRPLELGVDIVYHSATKYLSGHHDLMAGVIGCSSRDIATQLDFVMNATGSGLPPNDSFLLLRGIKTLAIRMDRQQENAIKISNFLISKGFHVHYPGLKSHPQYKIHMSQASGGGAVLSFETGNVEYSRRIVEAAQLWSISVSFGSVNSLISMPCYMSHASIPAHVRQERQLPEDLIRLCVGIEDAVDLINDLDQAIECAGLAHQTLET